MNNELWILDVIGYDGITATDIAKKLQAIGRVADLTVRLNSPGGDAFEGVTIYNLLKSSPAKITVKVDGLAASAASIIAMVGDEIEMADNAMLMIHDPLFLAYGTAKELRSSADLLDKLKVESLVPTYVNRTNQTPERIGELMAAETWLSAKEAVELGFATSISEGKKPLNILPERFRAAYKNAPKALLEPTSQAEQPAPQQAEPDLWQYENELRLWELDAAA